MVEHWFEKKNKKEGWEQSLRDFFVQWSNKSFEWGKTDCFFFAGAAIEAQTGENPMKSVEGLYGSHRAAYRLLKKGSKLSDGKFYQIDGFEGFWSAFLGEPKNPNLAQRGDLVMGESDDGKFMGVVDLDGSRIFAMSEPQGIIQLPLKKADLAWSV